MQHSWVNGFAPSKVREEDFIFSLSSSLFFSIPSVTLDSFTVFLCVLLINRIRARQWVFITYFVYMRSNIPKRQIPKYIVQKKKTKRIADVGVNARWTVRGMRKRDWKRSGKSGILVQRTHARRKFGRTNALARISSYLRSAAPIFLSFSFLVYEEDRNTSASQTTRSSATARKMVGKVEGRTQGLNKFCFVYRERQFHTRNEEWQDTREKEKHLYIPYFDTNTVTLHAICNIEIRYIYIYN